MDKNNQSNIELDDLLGKSIDGNILNSLITEGRIKFPDRPVTAPSAISKGSNDSCEIGTDGVDTTTKEDIKDLVDNVKENEDLVKTLEDMRDDLLKDMKITPKSDRVKDAAKLLGSKDGTITKPVFDAAETITSPDFVDALNGYNTKLAALLGDGTLNIPHSNCSEVTKAVFEGFDIVQKNDEERIKDILDNKAAMEDSFAKQMGEMFAGLLNKLFWNHIWCRMWTGIFDFVEKIIAKPIDALIIITRSLFVKPPFYIISTENYYKWGIIHKILNVLKLMFLCKIPRRAWSDFKPEEGIQIYVYLKGFMALEDLCKSNIGKDCPDYGTRRKQKADESGKINIVDDNGDIITDDKDKPGIGEGLDIIDTDCPDSDLDTGFKNTKKGDKSAVSPECLEAAKLVLEAAVNDALYNNNDDNSK